MRTDIHKMRDLCVSHGEGAEEISRRAVRYSSTSGRESNRQALTRPMRTSGRARQGGRQRSDESNSLGIVSGAVAEYGVGDIGGG